MFYHHEGIRLGPQLEQQQPLLLKKWEITAFLAVAGCWLTKPTSSSPIPDQVLDSPSLVLTGFSLFSFLSRELLTDGFLYYIGKIKVFTAQHLTFNLVWVIRRKYWMLENMTSTNNWKGNFQHFQEIRCMNSRSK